MKKEKIILVDVDGVIIDWEYGFDVWMESHGHIVQEEKMYNMERKYALRPGVALHQIQIFNESAAMGFLPPLRDAQYYVKMLHEKHMYRFVAITSFGTDTYAKKLRSRNLSKLFGPNTFKDIHCLPTGEYKYDILAKLAPKYKGRPFVEDNIDNAEAAHSLGYKAMLMSHGYNYEYSNENIPLYLNWESIYNEIIQSDQN
jgi:uncharacterized HAD superfamily protein